VKNRKMRFYTAADSARKLPVSRASYRRGTVPEEVDGSGKLKSNRRPDGQY
jgi:hypothetical protein